MNIVNTVYFIDAFGKRIGGFIALNHPMKISVVERMDRILRSRGSLSADMELVGELI